MDKDKRIIKYDNDFASMPLLGFTSVEADILMVTCYMCQQALENTYKSAEELERCIQEDVVRIRYELSDFVKICNYKKGGKKRLVKDVAKIYDKMITSMWVTVEEEENVVKKYPLFYEFKADYNNNIFECQIHKKAGYVLLVSKSGYTKHDLDEFLEIKNMFAKRCYRFLKKWRTVGVWRVSFEEFKRLMGIPDSYRQYDIDRRVLKVITDELSKYFEDLKITKIHGSKRGSPVEEIIISFKKENMSERKKTGFKCPVCGEPLVEIASRNGIFWGHSDGWKEDAKCRETFNSVSEIKGYEKEHEESSGMPEELKQKIKMLTNRMSNE